MSQAWKLRLEANRERAAQAKAELEAAKQRKVAEVVAAAGTGTNYAELNADDDEDALRDSTSKLDTTATFTDDVDTISVSAYSSDASRYGAAIYSDADLDDETRATWAKDDDELLSVGYGQPSLSSTYDEPDPTQAYDTAPPSKSTTANVNAYDTPDPEPESNDNGAKSAQLDAYEAPDPSKAVAESATAPTKPALDAYDAPDPTAAVVVKPAVAAATAAAAVDPYDVPAPQAAGKPTAAPIKPTQPTSDGYEAPTTTGTTTTTATKVTTPKPPTTAVAAVPPSKPADSTSFLARFDKWCDFVPPRGARTSRDWNEEFQRALGMADSHEKFVALRNLELDFVYAAQLYGKIIISEMSLPVSLKTIKPTSVGGIAGGEKYIVQGILFKFAVDLEGLYKSDENAMKAASHDLKGLMAFFTTGVAALHVPLMALIDYKGFRLQAISVLPIDKSTLAYGSSDGARTVHTSDARLNACMSQASALLGLKPHRVGPNEIEIAAVADIEGHVGIDGRFYLLDFARVAPPQPVTQADAGSNAQLYRLLRLEFVKRYVRPLSADAFSAMGRHNMREHNAEVRDAFESLAREVLPAFATSWSAKVTETLEKRDTFDERMATLGSLCAHAHAKGINVRLLGAVRASTNDQTARRLLLVEALARVAKNSMRALLRREARSSGVPCRERFNTLALAFLNLTLRPLSDAASEPFWSDLQAQAEFKFKLLFLRHDKTLPFVAVRDQMADVPHLLLFHRIVQLLAVELDVRAVRELDAAIGGNATLGSSAGFVLVQPDLLDQHVRTKHIGLVAYADAMQLFYSAQQASGDARLRLLTVARYKLDAARLSMVSDAMATYHLARTFQLMAECTADAAERADLLERAAEVFVALRAERIEPGMNAAVVLEIAHIETTRVTLLKEGKRAHATQPLAKAGAQGDRGVARGGAVDELARHQLRARQDAAAVRDRRRSVRGAVWL
jgi:hypothetical protein